MTPVVSSNILAIGYDVIQNILQAQFHSGQTYIYRGVTIEMYEELRASTSNGSFCNKNIKNKFNGIEKNAVYIERVGEDNGKVNKTL